MELLVLAVDGPGDGGLDEAGDLAEPEVLAAPRLDERLVEAAHVERRRVGGLDRNGDVLALGPDPGRLTEGPLDHRLEGEVEIVRVDLGVPQRRLVDLEDVLDRVAGPPAVAAGDRPDLLDARVAAQRPFEVRG